ncbi:MAG: hypothetical protein WC052_04725 [Patescibacteria group bacterium]|jgi:hypothetical protein
MNRSEREKLADVSNQLHNLLERKDFDGTTYLYAELERIQIDVNQLLADSEIKLPADNVESGLSATLDGLDLIEEATEIEQPNKTLRVGDYVQVARILDEQTTDKRNVGRCGQIVKQILSAQDEAGDLYEVEFLHPNGQPQHWMDTEAEMPRNHSALYRAELDQIEKPARLTIWGKDEMGCYADGTNGEDNRRCVLRQLLQLVINIEERENGDDPDFRPVIDEAYALQVELVGDASEGYEEEDAAIGLLNNHTEDGFSFQMYEGDLMLVDNEVV